MIAVTRYVTADGEEFSDFPAAKEHEDEITSFIDELERKCVFFDSEKRILNFEGKTLETRLAKIENTYNTITDIEVKEPVSSETRKFLSDCFGFHFPERHNND